MSDSPRQDLEQRLALVARGVQRMADAFGSIEQRLDGIAEADRLQSLSDRVDEYRVRARSEVGHISERIEKLEVEQQHLLDALRGVASNLPETTGTPDARPAWVDELLTRIGDLERRPAPALDLAAAMEKLIDAMRALRDDLAAAIGELRVEALTSVERLRDEVAIDRLEASMRDMAEDTSGLRADVTRSFDRVLHEISTTEESLKGEVRAIDNRLTGFGDDLRLVRGLRDGLEALASGVDAVRQLASRSATAGQMNELAGDLSNVLAEIESARSQVLAVDQQVGLIQASSVDVTARAELGREVESLERRVTDGIAELGSRIDALAERSSALSHDDPLAARLRSLATTARQLSGGIAEDLRARRKRMRRPVRER